MQTLGDVLDQSRELYVGLFEQAIVDNGNRYDLIIEPDYLTADGNRALEGELQLPTRADLALQSPDNPPELIRIDSTRILNFEPFSLDWSGTSISLSPFQWDYMRIDVAPQTEDIEWEPVRAWFLKWFEERPGTDSPCMNCLHFLSDPEPNDIGYRLYADLGTAPAATIEDLFDAASAMGIEELRIGSET